MSAEENKATARRINDEVWTNGSLDVIDEALERITSTRSSVCRSQSKAVRGFAIW
jgi:hypothetical protein